VTTNNPDHTGTDNNMGGTPAWVIWDDTNGDGSQITQTHTFDGGALTIGQTVSIDYAHNYNVAAGKTIGINLLGASGTEVSLFFTGGNNFFQYSDTGGGAGPLGATYDDTKRTFQTFSFTLTGANTYSATFVGSKGAFSGTFTGASITGIQVFNNDAGGLSDQFTNNLNIVPEPSTYALLGIGALAVVLVSRRRESQLALAVKD